MNIKKILGKVSSFAGSMIGGPFGGAVVKIAGKVLLDDENATEKDIIKALESSPDKIVELRKAYIDFENKQRLADNAELKIHSDDRDSARNLQIQTRDITPRILSLIVTVGFFGSLILFIFAPIPEGVARNIITIMIGALGVNFTQIINFYFGSSKGSKMKTEMMNSNLYKIGK